MPRTVIGVDIHPGSSPNSSKAPLYSAVVIRDGEVLATYEEITLMRALRLIIEYHADILATDNIYELADNVNKLAKLLSVIPHRCKLIQVTGYPPRTTLENIAQELGVPRGSGPLWSAYVIAQAAYKGVGDEVRLFLDKTKILITKNRTPGQGGMSRDRFLRGIRASVLQATREVKRILDQHGFEYDMILKRSRGGLEKSLFIVYAPREELAGLVKPIANKNVKIIVEPYRARPPSQEEKDLPLIVGIDPGSTVGIAVLDIEGRPLLVSSLKMPDRDEVISLISSLGKVVMVATDASKPPEFVKRISSLLNAKLYIPPNDLAVEEKVNIAREISEKYNIDIPDAHARDALAAAVKAYKAHKPLIDEAASKIEDIPGHVKWKVYADLLKGVPLSQILEKFFGEALRSREAEAPAEAKAAQAPQPSVSREQLQRIAELESMISRLREELRLREMEIEELRLELSLLRKRKSGSYDDSKGKIDVLILQLKELRDKLSQREAALDELRNQIHKLYELLKDVASGKAVILPSASVYLGLDTAFRAGVKGVYSAKAEEIPQEVINELREKRGFVVLTNGDNGQPLPVPVLKRKPIHEVNGFAFFESSITEEAERAWQELIKLEEARRRERILKMIEEYKKARKAQ